MTTTLLHQLPMIPHLTTKDGTAEYVADKYLGWDLLEVDEEFEEILICKPCSTAWTYTRSKHLLILCDEVAVVWLRECQNMSNLTAMG